MKAFTSGGLSSAGLSPAHSWDYKLISGGGILGAASFPLYRDVRGARYSVVKVRVFPYYS